MSLEGVRAAVGVELVDDGSAVGLTQWRGAERGGVFGGQLTAQALSAAAVTVPTGSVPDSIHAYLVGPSRTGEPVTYQVERVRDGRALQHRVVRGVQDGVLVIHATVVSSIPADGADWQAPNRPDAGPPDLRPDAPVTRYSFLGWELFDIISPSTGAGARPEDDHPVWVRCREDVDDDPWLWGAVHAFWSDFGLNGAARFLHEDVAG